jgi:tetratricopeptide (TPR) repeat protein
MRREEKIARFLEKNPRASEQQLQRKFGFSFREARAILEGSHNNEDSPQKARNVSLKKSIQVFVANFFSPGFSEKKILITLVVLAGLTRLCYIAFLVQYEILQLPLLDAEYYLLWAKEIVGGGWLGDTVFFTEPLYAYLLALSLTFFGNVGSDILLGFQFILGTLFPVTMYFLGKKLFSKNIGIVAGLITAVYGPFLMYEGLLLKTSLEIYTLPLFILLAWHSFEKPSRRIFFLTGLFLGGVVLIKGNALIFVPLMGVFIFHFLQVCSKTLRIQFMGLFIVGVLSCLLPITIRNYVVGHDIVPTNYSIGLVLYQGNWWGGDGSTARVPDFLRPHPKFEEIDAVKMAESYADRQLLPSEVSRFWMSKAIGEVFSYPRNFISNLGHKVLLLLNQREYSDNYSYEFYRHYIPFLWILPNYLLISVLGGTGFFLLFSRHFREMLSREGKIDKDIAGDNFYKARFLIIGLFVTYSGMLLLTTINSRYRMPLTPFLILLSAGTLTFFFEYFRERLFTLLHKTSLLLGVFVILAVLPLPLFKHLSFADAYHNVGYWYLERGEYGIAEGYFRDAIREDEEYAWAYKNLARIKLLEGKTEEAKPLLQKVVLIRYDDMSVYDSVELLQRMDVITLESERKAVAKDWFERTDKERVYDVYFYDASRFLDTGNNAKAEELLKQSLGKYGDEPSTLVRLAGLKTKQEDSLAAKQYLRRALAKNSYIFPARNNLANLYIAENNFKEVRDLLREVYLFSPELGEVWYNYGVSLMKIGEKEEGIKVMRAYVERYKDEPTKKEKVETFKRVLETQDKPLDEVMKNIKK